MEEVEEEGEGEVEEKTEANEKDPEPKRPGTCYLLFSEEKRPSVVKKNPSISMICEIDR